MKPLIWFITGGSSGMGRSLAMAALYAGHRVIATTRDLRKAAYENPDFEELGGIWEQLDVQSPDTQAAVSKIVREHYVDVVVNNAGMALLGALEDMSAEEVYDQMNTNFFGAVRVTKGAIPVFRERHNGCIVNISSAAAFIGLPSRSVYAASKSALESMTEALADELDSFNIRVFMVDLGAFATTFAASARTPRSQSENGGISKPYVGTMAHTVVRMTRELAGTSPGDPDQAAARIIESVTEQGMAGAINLIGYPRLILGSDSIKRAREKIKKFEENVTDMERIASSTDFKKDGE